ncbi:MULTISPECIES: hypothetical protein [Aquimarina]|uniref:hypothetical protein n=1 Tax=Aquimarina TaxID=290174 RepID=UPI000D69F8D9|nr:MULTISPECIES: hypothetical protein [Aquimarina]
MNKKIIRAIIIRTGILILPIIVLILFMEYGPRPEYNERHGHTDRGLGFAIMGVLWLLLFSILIGFEMLFKLYKRQKTWIANLIFIIIIAFFLTACAIYNSY